jgi:hypothetical protein
MDTKNYNDNTFNLIKLWHHIKNNINRERKCPNKMNSFDLTNSLLKKSNGNLLDFHKKYTEKKLKYNKSFNMKRNDFYSNYTVIT